MRSRLALTLRLAFVASLLPAVRAVAAEPERSADAPKSASTEAARAHFKAGVRLYQNQDHAAALAEFEAAYRLKPGPGSLQNIALCQKALRRYGEAVDSLGRLLTEHAAELSDSERTAAELAKAELEALVGRVRVELTPKTAELTLDGRPFVLREPPSSVALNAGEHTLAASAPGYARATRTVTVASGQSEVVVTLSLEPVSAFLEITALDPKAAIAIDGKPVAYGRYVGPVTPDTPHLVQIYGATAPPFETRVTAPLGKTVVVSNAPPSTTTPAPAAEDPAQSRPHKPRIGWYGTGSFALFAASPAPFRFESADASSRTWGVSVRGGRRFRPAVAVEGLLAYSALNVDGACDAYRGALAEPKLSCDSDADAALEVSYSVRSLRFGPNLALMSTGPQVRVLGSLGLGLVWHELRCDGCIVGKDEVSAGTDGYFLMELGVGANHRHLLFALTLQAIIDGTANMISGRNLGTEASPLRETAYARSDRVLSYLGLDLRVGYSEWAP